MLSIVLYINMHAGCYTSNYSVINNKLTYSRVKESKGLKSEKTRHKNSKTIARFKNLSMSK